MNSMEWLRTMVQRQQKKAPFTVGGVVAQRMSEQLPGLAELAGGVSWADIEAGNRALQDAIRLPGTQAPGEQPGGDAMHSGGQQCGCEARYSDHRCNRSR